MSNIVDLMNRITHLEIDNASGIFIRPEIKSELCCDLDMANRCVKPIVKFSIGKPVDIGDFTFPEGHVLSVGFGWHKLLSLGYSDKLEPVNDPGCVIDLSQLGRPGISPTLGQAGEYVDMRKAIELGIARMIERNSILRISYADNKITFHLDGGYTGQSRAICDIEHSTELKAPSLVGNEVISSSDPLLFFDIPEHKAKLTESLAN